MGCDWYDFSAVAGKGTVVVVKGEDQAAGDFVFDKATLEQGDDGNWTGTRAGDEPIENPEESEWVCVRFEKVYCKTEFDVPGPYEIKRDWRQVSITLGDDGMVMVAGTTNY